MSHAADSHNQAVYPLVLLGGGHSHALWIKYWQQLPTAHPAKRLRPLLISEHPVSPYSGMLPGLLTGQYNYDDCHIDLVSLCKNSGCDFKQATCISIRQVDDRLYRLAFKSTDQGAPTYILCSALSINIGSQPFSDIEVIESPSVPGNLNQNLTWKVKPISQFFAQWKILQETLSETPSQARVIRIIGAGAAGVEVACAIKVAQANCHVEIESHSPKPLPHFSSSIQNRCLKKLKEMDIEFNHTGHLNKRTADVRIFCTQSTAPSWLQDTDLHRSEQGFISVDEHLQTSLPGIFAAGDCIHFQPQPLPKAGVYAVRQAHTLFNNICAYLTNEPLLAFKPQTQFLSIINMGNHYALAQRGFFSAHGYWLWRYKHFIDLKFMNQFKKSR